MSHINLWAMRKCAENGDETPGIHETLMMADAMEGMAKEIASHRDNSCEVGVSFSTKPEDVLNEYGFSVEED